MPLFFFDIHDGKWSRDEIGVDLPSVEAACAEARRALLELLNPSLLHADSSVFAAVFVADANRKNIYSATMLFAELELTP